jgi:Zn-dependent protease
MAAREAFQPDVGADAHHLPLVAAAGMGFAQSHHVTDLDRCDADERHALDYRMRRLAIISPFMNGPLVGIFNGLTSGDVTLILAQLIVLVLLLGVAFPIHELAHALTARYLGDDTGERMGRITLNPLAHLDPFGTLLFALTGFGWARPVPVNLYRLQGNPRTSFAIVALAGPLSNLALAALFALLFRFALPLAGADSALSRILLFALSVAVQLNIFLALFNLIPIPPLDGSRLLTALLPDQGQALMDQLERYGFIILIALSATGVLGQLIVRPAMLLSRTLLGL